MNKKRLHGAPDGAGNPVKSFFIVFSISFSFRKLESYLPVTLFMKDEALLSPIWNVNDLPEAIFIYR